MEKIIEIIPLIPGYLSLMCQVLGGVVLIATVVVELTPSKKDDLKMSSYRAKFVKFLGWLPTIGVNPRTKQLEDYLKSLS